MKFEGYDSAVRFAKMETIRTHWEHRAVCGRYFSLTLWEYLPCWTVVFIPKRVKFGA